MIRVYDSIRTRAGVACGSCASSLSRLSCPRSASAWGTYNGKIYVAGGEFQNPQLMAAFRAFEAYDPSTNTWASLPSMPVPRHGLAGAVAVSVPT